jgi:excisionase family DNA binding protein
MSDQILLSRREAAKALGISIRTLDTIISSKELAVRRIGRRRLIARVALERFARGDHQTRLADEPAKRPEYPTEPDRTTAVTNDLPSGALGGTRRS